MAIRLFFALVPAAGLAGSASAQTNLGILLGVSSSSLNGDTPPNGTYTRKSSPIVGLSVEFGIGDGLYLIMQPQYLTRGTGVAFAVADQTEPRDSRRAPVFVHGSRRPSAVAHFRGAVGPLPGRRCHDRGHTLLRDPVFFLFFRHVR